MAAVKDRIAATGGLAAACPELFLNCNFKIGAKINKLRITGKGYFVAACKLKLEQNLNFNLNNPPYIHLS